MYVKNLHDYMFTNPNNIHFKEDYCRDLNATCGVDILRVRREVSQLTKYLENKKIC